MRQVRLKRNLRRIAS